MTDAEALGAKLEMATGLIATSISGARHRLLTVGEFLDGRPAGTINVAVADDLLKAADALLAADPAAFFMRMDGEDMALVHLSDVTAKLREVLVTAAPFVKKPEAPKP